MDNAKQITGFPPIVSQKSRVMILGSMPSAASLKKQQYYAHPRNAFWPIMQNLLIFDMEIDYQQRKQKLMLNGIAVWDVLQSCSREGSMDADIKTASVITNDFIGFFQAYPLIKHVFFNGGMAEKLFDKHVWPEISEQFSWLEFGRLPSTSPAYASMPLADKKKAWQIIQQQLNSNSRKDFDKPGY